MTGRLRFGTNSRGLRRRLRLALPAASIALVGLLCVPSCSREADVDESERIAKPPGCEDLAVQASEIETPHRLRRLSADLAPAPARFVRPREIGGQARPVLPGTRSMPALSEVFLDLPRDAHADFRRRIDLDGKLFYGVERVVVAPRVHIGGWRDLEPVTLQILRDAVGRHVELELDLRSLADSAGRSPLRATVYTLTSEPRLAFETPPFTLPRGDIWLSTSLGVLPPARDQGPARFRLSACEDGNCRCLFEESIDPLIQTWVPKRVPMEGLTGREISLRFESELIAPSENAFHLGQWESPRWLAAAVQPTPGLHDLLIISLDTLRADHLEVHGYERDTSPFLSGDLAPRGAVLEQAIAPATTTAPSHMSLFTSLQPSVHGVASNLRENALPAGVPTLASTLQAAGYVTGSFNENGSMSRRHGFARGFDEYMEMRSPNVMRPPGFADEVFRRGADFVERHQAERWMLFLHTYAVHDPYTPAKRYDDLFADGDAPGHPDNVRMGERHQGARPVLYDREIRQVDDALASLFARLRRAGLLDDAIVVVTSDHGDAFFEHGRLGHGSDVYQETVHVPLFVFGPGIAAGQRIDAPVSLIDVMPTLLDLVGVAPPGGLSGHSFAGLLRGEPEEIAWRTRPVVSEAWHPWARTRTGRVAVDPPALAIRVGRYKLVRSPSTEGPRDALFDLESDPFERVDLLADARPLPTDVDVEALRALADAYPVQSASLASQLGLPPLDARPVGVDEISPERRESLRALGYIE